MVGITRSKVTFKMSERTRLKLSQVNHEVYDFPRKKIGQIQAIHIGVHTTPSGI